MRMMFILLVLFAAGCAGAPGQSPTSEQAPNQDSIEIRANDPAAETYVYRCPDGFKFTAVIGRDQSLLLLPDGEARVRRERSSSGVKYSGDGVMFWSKGDTAIFEKGSKLRKGCTVDWKASVWEEARLSGVDFRAVGQEPGWRLDIYNGERIVLVKDYGRKRQEFPAVVPEVDRLARTAIYETRNEKYELRVIIEGRRCTDEMSGSAYPARATVILDGKVLEGCGRALR